MLIPTFFCLSLSLSCSFTFSPFLDRSPSLCPPSLLSESLSLPRTLHPLGLFESLCLTPILSIVSTLISSRFPARVLWLNHLHPPLHNFLYDYMYVYFSVYVWLSLSLSLPLSLFSLTSSSLPLPLLSFSALQCIAVCCSVLQCIVVYNLYAHKTCLLFPRRASRVMLTKMYICACLHT